MSRLGLISDTHDRLGKVRAAVELFNRLEPDLVLHCGDFVAQFTLAEFGKLKMGFLGIFGNNDGDRDALRERAGQFGFELAEGPHRFTVGGRAVVVSHEPIAVPTDCDYYIHGHTHRMKLEPGSPTIINPGEACGWLSDRSTAALLDTETGSVEFFDL